MGYATQVWSPQSIELITRLERIQRRASKFILGLPFSTEVTYVSRLQSLYLIPLCYWHEYLDLVFLYKITHGLVKAKNPPVQKKSRSTRLSSRTNIRYVIPRCKTTTHQRSFQIRTTRVWNTISQDIDLNTDSLNSLKRVLYQYYITPHWKNATIRTTQELLKLSVLNVTHQEA